MSFTVDQVIARYVALRDEKNTIIERHRAELAPFDENLAAIEQWLLAKLNSDGADSFKTEHGTAFKATVMSTTVDPEGGWEKLLDFIVMKALDRVADAMERNASPEEAAAAFRQTPELALINRSVNKTAVKELLEQGDGAPPPGVKIAQVTNLNVRRA